MSKQSSLGNPVDARNPLRACDLRYLTEISHLPLPAMGDREALRVYSRSSSRTSKSAFATRR
jgi:hypothetical protein